MSTSATRKGARCSLPSAAKDVGSSGLPERIYFGRGGIHLAAELRHVHAERVLFVCSERQVAAVQQTSQQVVADHDIEVAVLGGSESSSASAYDAARTHGSDVVVAVGGGTVIDQAKRACTILDIPLIALPTTYSAAELDRRVRYRGLSANGPVFDAAVAPAAVVYDPCLTLTLSPRQTGLSLVGAIGAGVEVLRSAEVGSSLWTLAHHGLRELGRAALDTVYRPDSLPARSVVQFGAYLVGAAVATAQTSAVASAARELAAVSGLNYAEARAMVSLSLVDTVAEARSDVCAVLLSSWSCTGPATFLHDLATGSGAARVCPEWLTRHVAAIARKYGI